MNRWTIEALNATDDITFAMWILSECGRELNPEAPLAKKLAKAHQTLDALRGHQPLPPIGNTAEIARTRIYDEICKQRQIKAMEEWLRKKKFDMQGLTPEQILVDTEIIDQILYLYGKCEIGDDEYYAWEYSIEQGIKDILKQRKAAT